MNRRSVRGALGRYGGALAASMSRRKSRRRSHDFQLVSNSQLFDAEWYLQIYPDISRAKIDPLRHYMELGWREGRDPGPAFATSAYLKANPDVAAAGVNPLLHFLEFGHFEGRGSFAHGPITRQSRTVSTAFGPAAPVVSFPLAEVPPTRWRRAFRLDRSRDDFLAAGDCAVGYASDETDRQRVSASFAFLKALSGFETPVSRTMLAEVPASAARMVDGWFINERQLRTRWDGAFPIVVRAFQHDPADGGKLCAVGEGVAECAISPIDLHLRSPFFPVLVVFADPDGAIIGSRHLAFPSLCRGGAHYGELLAWSAPVGGLPNCDPIAAGELLASRLVKLIDGSAAAVAKVEVEIADADGRGRLFQADLQLWLEKVVGVGLGPRGCAFDAVVHQHLADALSMPQPASYREDGDILVVGPNMVPTIGALTAARRPGESGEGEFFVPLIVSAADPSEPALSIEIPADLGDCADARLVSAKLPRLTRARSGGLATPVPAAAIAEWAGGKLSEAELFMPFSGSIPTTALERREAISWAVEADGWPEGILAQAVHALSLQTGGGGDFLIFVGTPDPISKSVAAERFAGRVKVLPTLPAAIAAAETALFAFVGAGVVLHDGRSAAALGLLLSNDVVASASCVIIKVTEFGSASHSAIADGGAFDARGGVLGANEYRAAAGYLWGTSYPVSVPGPHLWLARTSCVADWLSSSRRGELGNRVHICSSAVTASQVAANASAELPRFIPRAAAERATRVQALFG